MKKSYKCSNIKFCIEDENQRRTWEYLQGITRKDGSYGKVLSDVFVAVLDGKIQTGSDKAVGDFGIPLNQDMDILEKMLDRVLEQKFHEMLQALQRVLYSVPISGKEAYGTVLKSLYSAPSFIANDGGILPE